MFSIAAHLVWSGVILFTVLKEWWSMSIKIIRQNELVYPRIPQTQNFEQLFT